MAISWGLLVVFVIVGYGVGSIPSAVIVCRLLGLPNPLKSGSQNPGATNVLRIGGKKAAIITLVADILKGFLPTFLALKVNPFPWFVGPVMVATVLGHLYPVFLRFKGGKGVATSLGVLAGFSGLLGFMLVLSWLMVVWVFPYSSLGALFTALAAPFYTFYLFGVPYTIPVVVISLFVIWRHRANIKRLWKREEPKIGKKTP